MSGSQHEAAIVMRRTAIRTPICALFLGCGLMAAAPGGAAARPRDDVMSSAFRCASIGDARTWLDCYYGAAQPVRSALRLRPAPAEQSRLVANPPAGNPSPTDLLLRNQVMSQAVRCSPQAGERQWLDCYYEAARPVRVQLGLESARPSPPQPLASTGTEVGLAIASQSPPARAIGSDTRVPARMVSYTFDNLGYFTITLDNGQVWKQVNGDTSYAHWKKPAETYVVRITRGFLGSRNVTVQGEPGLFRVSRLR